MNDLDIISLLRRSESETLDFKSKQYLFAGASDGEKAELLKDILAMANAWKESDGYIVIGVEELHGRANRVCGADPTLPDSDVQQFVNSKTNRPVLFRIVVLQHEGVSLTVIHIDSSQNRPIFLKRSFGQLEAKAVYVRRGSSTDKADPDETAQMGRVESLTQREEEKWRAKKEIEDHFWREFKTFLPVFHNKACLLNSSTGYISDAILEHRLPLDEVSDFLRRARELDLSKELIDELKELKDNVRKIDDYMNLGAEKLQEWRGTFRSIVCSVFVKADVLERKYLNQLHGH